MNSAEWLKAADRLDDEGWPDVPDEMRRIAHGRIYVVTTGEYSDYGIKGLFLTKEAAEACRAELAKEQYTHPNDVEEYVLDALATHKTEKFWQTTIGVDGQIKDRQERAEFGEAKGRAEVAYDQPGSVTYLQEYWRKQPKFAYMAEPYLVAQSTVSQEHADKVAIEQWQMRLMDGRWKQTPEECNKCRVKGHVLRQPQPRAVNTFQCQSCLHWWDADAPILQEEEDR